MNAEESRVMAAVVDALKAISEDLSCKYREGEWEYQFVIVARDALAQVAALQREGDSAEPMMLAPVWMLRQYQDMVASCDGDTTAVDALFGESSDEEE